MQRLRRNTYPYYGIKNVPTETRNTFSRISKELDVSQAELLTYIAQQLEKGRIKVKV